MDAPGGFWRLALETGGFGLVWWAGLIGLIGATAWLGGRYHEAKRRRRRRELAEQNLLQPAGRLRARMRRMARPTLLLTPTAELGFSKIGGMPELPADLAWPAGVEGPRVFVAQIDLAAFRPHVDIDWLPAEGRLYFFYDDERNGAVDVVQVLHSLRPPGPMAEAPAPVPKRWRFQERRVGFMRFDSVPSLDWLDVDPSALDLEDEDLERLVDELNLFGDEIEHRIGGYPSEIQSGAMAIDCEYMRRGSRRNYDEEVPDAIGRAARQWRLLLQVDSDPALGMNWWDAGRLYVFIREQDARAGDFSKTVTITQTH